MNKKEQEIKICCNVACYNCENRKCVATGINIRDCEDRVLPISLKKVTEE